MKGDLNMDNHRIKNLNDEPQTGTLSLCTIMRS